MSAVAAAAGAGQAARMAGMAGSLQCQQILGQVILQTLAETQEAEARSMQMAAGQAMGKGLNVDRVV